MQKHLELLCIEGLKRLLLSLAGGIRIKFRVVVQAKCGPVPESMVWRSTQSYAYMSLT